MDDEVVPSATFHEAIDDRERDDDNSADDDSLGDLPPLMATPSRSLLSQSREGDHTREGDSNANSPMSIHKLKELLDRDTVMETPETTPEAPTQLMQTHLGPIPRKRKMSSVEYDVVDQKIVIDPTYVLEITAPERIKLFCQHFGTTNPESKTQWTTPEIVRGFSDLCNHGIECTVTRRKIGSGSQWYCKGMAGELVCGPCRVRKVTKQIGCRLRKDLAHLDGKDVDDSLIGGVPRLILSIAEKLLVHKHDYRDLALIFTPLSALQIDLSSCNKLWNICREETTYLLANKRFLGCLMSAGYRPKSDRVEWSNSKGLGNLWHENKVWRDCKYVVFTQKCRFRPGKPKVEERKEYEEEVIRDSVAHVERKHCDWKELACGAWKELMVAYRFLSKGFRLDG